jgi:transcriptional regulator with XRE-family HTH domain
MTNREGRWSAGFVPMDERERLRAGFGEALSRARRAAGLTAKELAKRTGISESHVYALQAGSSRTRPATIAALCRVLAPDDADRLEHELTVLAGESLRPDTPRGSRRRQRREARAARQLPALETRLEALRRKAERLHAEVAARRVIVSGGMQAIAAARPVPVDEVQARIELAALDQAVAVQRRQWEAQQWQAEQRMMRGDHHVKTSLVARRDDDANE